MAAEMDVAIRDHIHADLRHGLETMIRFLESLGRDDQELLPIQMSNSWCNLDRVSTQLHTIQVSKERMQQVLAVYLKWATDESVVIKKEIATLDGFVSIATDEQTEIEAQEEHAQQLIDTYSKHLKEAEEQLRRKTSQNWRIAKVFTNALANSEAEARRAFRQMADFTSGHTSRYKSTMDRRQESVEAISKARSKHENLVNNELCEKLDEINQLNICFRSEKNQSEELAIVSAILDPITIYCHVLCEVCQQLPVDPMIIQPILEELNSSLQRCFSQEAEGLYTLQKENDNLQLLAAGVASISCSQMVPSLSFDDDTFSQLEFPLTHSGDRSLAEETGGFNVSFLVGDNDSDDDDQTIPMQVASGSAAAASCDVTDHSPRDLCGAMSRDLTLSDSESRGTLVAPEAERMESIKTSIKNMETLSSGDDTDFSLSEFPPKDGFDYLEWPSSFQASIIQLQSAWWACLVATRNSFLMFQLYTRTIAVCLIQADQTLQMGREEDISLYLHKTLPVLEKSSQTIRKIAEQLENNFGTLMGIVAELTETCTVASGNASTNQRQLSAKEQVNLKEKETTEVQIREMIEQRKRLAASIKRAEEEFAKVVLELPGVFNLLTKSAADKCSEGLHGVTSFFRKFTGNLVRFDIFGCFNTIRKDLVGLGKKFIGFITDDAVDYGEEAIEYETGNSKAEEELSREALTYIEVVKIRAAIDLILQMLLDQGNLNVQRSSDVVWEGQAKLDANIRALKKIGNDAELARIVSSILNVCELVLNESKSFNPSEETYQQVISILSEAQESIDAMAKTLKEKLDAKTAERDAAATQDVTKEKKDIRYPVLEQIAQRRSAKGKELRTLWKRYDRQTEHITSHFEVQKETAELLSGLTVELNVLEKTLDLMSKASADLTNLQKNVQMISGFAQQVSNVIQITLCPRLDKFALEMRHCQVTVQRSERGSVSNLQQETLQKEIRDAGRTAKQVYQCSKDFVTRGYNES